MKNPKSPSSDVDQAKEKVMEDPTYGHDPRCNAIPVTVSGPGSSMTACGRCNCGLDQLLAVVGRQEEITRLKRVIADLQEDVERENRQRVKVEALLAAVGRQQKNDDHGAGLIGQPIPDMAGTELRPISIEKLEGEWDGDRPSYVVSDDREGVCLCICWLPDVASRIRDLLSKTPPADIPVIVLHPGGQREQIDVAGFEGRRLNRLAVGCREYFFDKAGYYDGWGERLIGSGNQPSMGPADATRRSESAMIHDRDRGSVGDGTCFFLDALPGLSVGRRIRRRILELTY